MNKDGQETDISRAFFIIIILHIIAFIGVLGYGGHLNDLFSQNGTESVKSFFHDYFKVESENLSSNYIVVISVLYIFLFTLIFRVILLLGFSKGKYWMTLVLTFCVIGIIAFQGVFYNVTKFIFITFSGTKAYIFWGIMLFLFIVLILGIKFIDKRVESETEIEKAREAGRRSIISSD